ncbi:MAG: response regulator [Kineosporiaceae bacterium]
MTFPDPAWHRAGAPAATLTAAIIEDHPLYREALERALVTDERITLDLSTGSLEEFTARVRTRPDVVVADLRLPGRGGFDGIRDLVGRGFAVLVLSGSVDGADVLGAISEGARGYVSKDAQAHEIVTAVRTVAAGRTYVSPTLAGLLLQASRPRDEPGVRELTERERTVLSLVARGHTDHQIADRLGLGVSTVRSHLDRIRDKTGQRRRADLTRFALENEILADTP